MVVPVIILGILAVAVLIAVTTLTTEWYELLILAGIVLVMYMLYKGVI